MIFADFCSLRIASSSVSCSRGSQLIVMALGNEDHRGKVEANGRNGRRQQWEWKRIERRAPEFGQSEIEHHPACNRDGYQD